MPDTCTTPTRKRTACRPLGGPRHRQRPAPARRRSRRPRLRVATHSCHKRAPTAGADRATTRTSTTNGARTRTAPASCTCSARSAQRASLLATERRPSIGSIHEKPTAAPRIAQALRRGAHCFARNPLVPMTQDALQRLTDPARPILGNYTHQFHQVLTTVRAVAKSEARALEIFSAAVGGATDESSDPRARLA
jgi:hypothetical protein